MRVYDEKKAARLEAQPWMLDLLKRNPSYVQWGPHEDFMWKKGESWDSAVVDQSWGGFGFRDLDELNEVVNFYFQVTRPSIECDMCNGKGYHPDAQWVSESWYKHTSPFTVPDSKEVQVKAIMATFGSTFTVPVMGRGQMPDTATLERYGPAFYEHCVTTMENGGEWGTAILQDEVDSLWDSHRLRFEFKEKPTAAQVNQWQKGRGMGHDLINSWICIEQRLKRLGIPKSCPKCDGHTSIYTGPAYVNLVLWMIHPRKGASRGIEVRIDEHQVPEVLEYLREAARRNAARFSGVLA